ncbi:MAG: LptA/OstA family protein [Verrucomicrobiia bacterium]
MKRFCLIVLAAGSSLLAQAQTNTTGTLPTARGPTLISSASADFDLAGHEATYHGRVRVDDPQMKLACEQLIADVPQAGGHVNHIVAETNVVIDFTDNKGQTNHATGDKAVYIYEEEGGVTNETITLTGNPQIDNVQFTLTGDVIVWDRQNNHLSASNQKMVSHQNLSGLMSETNSPPPPPPPAKTNAPPEPAGNANTLMQ